MKNERLEAGRWVKWCALIVVGLAIVFVPVPHGSAAPVERTYRIEASRFAYAPAVLTANPGDRVTLELTATDVVHGLSLDGYNLEVSADPGQTARLTFVADRQGSFRFRCTVTCGNLHPFMIGKIEVGQNPLLWRGIALMGLAVIAGMWGLPK